jgi:hypothetical protein
MSSVVLQWRSGGWGGELRLALIASELRVLAVGFPISELAIAVSLQGVHLFEAFYAIYVNSHSLSISNFLAAGSAA